MALLFCIGALIALATLIFRLATYALPTLVGVALAVLAYKTGAGIWGAIAAGFLGAALAIGLGQWLAAPGRPQALRQAVALAFAAPAALTGFFLVHGLTAEAVASPVWRVGFSGLGALMVAASAVTRIVGPDFVQGLWRARTLTPNAHPAEPHHVV